MSPDEAIATLRETFGSIEVTTEPLPAGTLTRAPAVLARVRARGGVNPWTDPAADELDRLEELGVLDTLANVAAAGLTLVPCPRCGEPTVRPRNAPAGKCRITPGCAGE